MISGGYKRRLSRQTLMMKQKNGLPIKTPDGWYSKFREDWTPTLTPIKPPQAYSEVEMWDANGARLR